ncbi:MAG: hypothetical protein ACE5OP_03430 [Candidatus Glassbacteria bacterium]
MQDVNGVWEWNFDGDGRLDRSDDWQNYIYNHGAVLPMEYIDEQES